MCYLLPLHLEVASHARILQGEFIPESNPDNHQENTQICQINIPFIPLAHQDQPDLLFSFYASGPHTTDHVVTKIPSELTRSTRTTNDELLTIAAATTESQSDRR